jgi:hypothetical protein
MVAQPERLSSPLRALRSIPEAMPRVVVMVLLVSASAVVTLARLGVVGGADVAAAPIAGSTSPDPSHYPQVASLATDVSPARHRFIARVDRTCVRTYNRGRASQAAYARRVTGRPDAQELITSFYVRWHTGQYRALRALGKPPEARLEYRRWLDNMGARVGLEARYVPLMRAGRAAEAQTVGAQVNALKARGNMLGQRFGLQLCTSNGPGRRPVPD